MRKFDPEKVPKPKDFRPWELDPSMPLDIEIGCGVGFHPLQYARAHPERQLVAIERTSEKFEKFMGRLHNHDPIPNLIPVHGDAIAWIAHGVRPRTVDRYLILYPNPYPKKSQENLRFYAMPFMACLVDTLKPGGTITLATNERFYYEATREALQAEWGLKLIEDRALSATDPPRTHFEKKYLTRGETCWNLVFRKE